MSPGSNLDNFYQKAYSSWVNPPLDPWQQACTFWRRAHQPSCPPLCSTKCQTFIQAAICASVSSSLKRKAWHLTSFWEQQERNVSDLYRSYQGLFLDCRHLERTQCYIVWRLGGPPHRLSFRERTLKLPLADASPVCPWKASGVVTHSLPAWSWPGLCCPGFHLCNLISFVFLSQQTC